MNRTPKGVPRDGDGVRRSASCPIYLQWAGHAVCIVGAVRRQMSSTSGVEKVLLIFNSERRTDHLHCALSAPDDERPDGSPAPFPLWWTEISWTLKTGAKRITREAACQKTMEAAAVPGNGPGGESGPYQVCVIPYGWETRQVKRRDVRHPEQECTQHIGSDPEECIGPRFQDGSADSPSFESSGRHGFLDKYL